MSFVFLCQAQVFDLLCSSPSLPLLPLCSFPVQCSSPLLHLPNSDDLLLAVTVAITINVTSSSSCTLPPSLTRFFSFGYVGKGHCLLLTEAEFDGGFRSLFGSLALRWGWFLKTELPFSFLFTAFSTLLNILILTHLTCSFSLSLSLFLRTFFLIFANAHSLPYPHLQQQS